MDGSIPETCSISKGAFFMDTTASDIPVEELRSGLPLLDTCYYFNTGGIAPGSKAVTDTLTDEFLSIARNGPPLIMDPTSDSARMTGARSRMASFLGVEPEDLCLTRGVSDGVQLVFRGISWKPGDEVIITDEEHPAVQTPVDRLASRYGVILKRVIVSSDPDQTLRRFNDLLSTQTRFVALSHVTTDTGTRLPVEAICRASRERDIPTLLDGAQSLGQFPVHVASLGVDFYSFLCYKWLFAPYSTGGLYIAPAWRKRLGEEAAGDWRGREARTEARWFEEGPVTPPLYYATARAFQYIEDIGPERIEARRRTLVRSAREALNAIPGLTLHSPEPDETSTGIIAFSIHGVDGRKIYAGLKDRRFITRPTGLKFSGVRISIAFFNTEEEIGMLIRTIAELARQES
jgi:selenocysteine lyase/cysteine desulfurase